MNDFDYDAMQKKRIARGAAHMKRGSKSKKCTLPSDYLTAAQRRKLNGPVSTYKLDEPMNWESFKAMPEDLQKQYILGLQENYGANDEMMGKMFKKSDTVVLRLRNALNIKPLGKCKLNRNEKAIRDAKWDAFCNGVVGGKPGEPKKIENDEVEESCDEIDDFSVSVILRLRNLSKLRSRLRSRRWSRLKNQSKNLLKHLKKRSLSIF